MEETNGQGAGCTAGAGRERDMWRLWWVNEVCPTGGELDEDMEERGGFERSAANTAGG